MYKTRWEKLMSKKRKRLSEQEYEVLCLRQAADEHLAWSRVLRYSSFSGVAKSVMSGPFAIFSAERSDLPTEENSRRTSQLKRILINRLEPDEQPLKNTDGPIPSVAGQHGFVPGRGVWKGAAEKSLFIPMLSEDDTRAICAYFRQDAYVWGDGSKDHYKVQPTAGGDPYLEGKVSADFTQIKGDQPRKSRDQDPPPGMATTPPGPESSEQQRVKEERYLRWRKKLDDIQRLVEEREQQGMVGPIPGERMPSGYDINSGNYTDTSGRRWKFREPDSTASTSSRSREAGYLYHLNSVAKYIPSQGVVTASSCSPLNNFAWRTASGDPDVDSVFVLIPVESIDPDMSSSKTRRT